MDFDFEVLLPKCGYDVHDVEKVLEVVVLGYARRGFGFWGLGLLGLVGIFAAVVIGTFAAGPSWAALALAPVFVDHLHNILAPML